MFHLFTFFDLIFFLFALLLIEFKIDRCLNHTRIIPFNNVDHIFDSMLIYIGQMYFDIQNNMEFNVGWYLRWTTTGWINSLLVHVHQRVRVSGGALHSLADLRWIHTTMSHLILMTLRCRALNKSQTTN